MDGWMDDRWMDGLLQRHQTTKLLSYFEDVQEKC